MSQPTKGMNRGKDAPAPKVRRVAVNRRARATGLSAALWEREILDRLVRGLADVPVFLTDAQGLVTGISPALERLSGYSSSEIVGRRAAEFWADSVADGAKLLDELAIRDRIAGVEVSIKAKDGEIIRRTLTAGVVKDSRGRVAGIVGSLVESPREAEDRALAAAEADSHDEKTAGLIWLDVDDCIVRWNEAAEAIFGYTECEAVGRGLSLLIPDRRVRFRVAGAMRADPQDGDTGMRQTILAADKGRRELRLDTIWRFLRDDEGGIIGREIRIESSARMVDRRAPVSPAAREAGALIAHEVRNPLASIYLNVEMLGEQLRHIPDDAIRNEAFELVESVMGEVEHLKDIAREYLERAGAPRMRLQKQSLHEMLLELQRFMKKEMEFHHIEFANKFSLDMPEISFDRERLKEAIMNLYKNSADAMPEGGEISTSTAVSVGVMGAVSGGVAGGWAEILISDTGPGISDTDAASLFRPYFTTKETGTGLGLAIVEEILEAHGGAVEVRCERGEGMLLVLRLPLES